MRKSLLFLLFALLPVFLSGCSKASEEDVPKTTAAINNDAPAAGTANGADPPNPAMGAPGAPKKKGSP